MEKKDLSVEPMPVHTCKLCNNAENNKTIIVEERMFNLRDRFEYIECDKCGCVQIGKIPDNMDRYYPKNYYSFAIQSTKTVFQYLFMKVKHFLLKNLVKYRLGENNFLGFIASKRYTGRYYWINKKICNTESKILDVGCGSGQLLIDMQKHGFKNLTGIDPYIATDIIYNSSLKIEKKYIHELHESFDFIMLHHSFEHMDNPEAVMKDIYRLLNPAGYALIRIPVASSYAHKKYGVNWYQLDAPRHFFIHTPTSVKNLAEKVGLELKPIVYDSNECQFIISENYLAEKNIPFSRKKRREFLKMAKELNVKAQGDQACFYIYKRGDK
jgi:SAM-dependent methyltransferase